MNPQPKVKPWRSEKYRRFVASLPCAICGGSDVQAHHEQAAASGKMGGKVSDELCVPFCIWHHSMRHANPKNFWEWWEQSARAVIEETQSAWLAKGNKALWLAQHLD